MIFSPVNEVFNTLNVMTTPHYCFEVDNTIGEDDVEMIPTGAISIYSDGSLHPRRKSEGSGGGAVILIPKDVTGTRNMLVTFALKFPTICDINSAEAKMAEVAMEWTQKNYPCTRIDFHMDSDDVLRRVYELLVLKRSSTCDCYHEVYDNCGGDLVETSAVWGKRFINDKNGRLLNRCKFCQGCRKNNDSLSQSYNIQEHVEAFASEISNHKGKVCLYKVVSHENNWGNNYADKLANSGRLLENSLMEVEYI